MSAVDISSDATSATSAARERWSSRLAFILAAAGSAVGLGSIWKFPYITGVNGGGGFVLVYLACIVLVAAPIMIAEILIGRAAQRSPVAAFAVLDPKGRSRIIGWLGVAAAFLILSYYFVVSGWTLRYAWLALSGSLFECGGAAHFQRQFARVHADGAGAVLWQGVFVALTAAIVVAGVREGIERCCRVLFPLLLAILIALLIQAWNGEGFAKGIAFVFEVRWSELSSAGVLEALGHSFFTLSLGMGAMITYGSYLGRRDDVVIASGAIAGLDTLVSLLACATIFPIIFAIGLAPDVGPGLVFVSLPTAFEQMPGGAWWAGAFFAVLAMAALSSTVSVFEVIVSHLMDVRAFERVRATCCAALALFIAGVPSALSGDDQPFGEPFRVWTQKLFSGEGRSWFDLVDHLASNWLLPLSGLGIAWFLAWRISPHAREQAFKSGARFARLYWLWVWLLRFFVPPAVIAVFLHATGVL